MSSASTPQLRPDDVQLGPGARRAARTFLVAGTVGMIAAVALAAASADGWARFHRSYLVAFLFFMALSLGALFFVLVQHATRAGWSVGVRRLAESVAAGLLVPMAPLVLPVVFGLGALYPWTDTAAVSQDPLLVAKAPWLNVPFFLARTAVYFGIWAAFATWFRRRSLLQDRTGDARLTNTMETTSTAALIFFAFTVTFFAFDFVMSLTPHWYSTIFGVYFFSGCVLSSIAFLTVLVGAVQGRGLLRGVVTIEHYHDLGKLIFAFTIFWAYIGFSQYMLMWYANLPEETVWYAMRQTGGWTGFSVALLLGHFFFPFLALMSRFAKRRRPWLVAAACWMLAMQWMDVYWLVMPPSSPGRVPLGILDVATFVGVGGLFLAGIAWRLGGAPAVPTGDPRLAESLRFENY